RRRNVIWPAPALFFGHIAAGMRRKRQAKRFLWFYGLTCGKGTIFCRAGAFSGRFPPPPIIVGAWNDQAREAATDLDAQGRTPSDAAPRIARYRHRRSDRSCASLEDDVGRPGARSRGTAPVRSTMRDTLAVHS